MVDEIYPLTCRFILVRCQDLSTHQVEEETPAILDFRVVDLDWSTGKSQVGDSILQETFDPYQLRVDRRNGVADCYEVVIDQAAGLGSKDAQLQFLLCKRSKNSPTGTITCWHLRMIVADCQLQQLGETLRFPLDEYNCLGLNNDVLSGISSSFDSINQFDLRTRRKINQTQFVHEHPLQPTSINVSWADFFVN